MVRAALLFLFLTSNCSAYQLLIDTTSRYYGAYVDVTGSPPKITQNPVPPPYFLNYTGNGFISAANVSPAGFPTFAWGSSVSSGDLDANPHSVGWTLKSKYSYGGGTSIPADQQQNQHTVSSIQSSNAYTECLVILAGGAGENARYKEIMEVSATTPIEIIEDLADISILVNCHHDQLSLLWDRNAKKWRVFSILTDINNNQYQYGPVYFTRPPGSQFNFKIPTYMFLSPGDMAVISSETQNATDWVTKGIIQTSRSPGGPFSTIASSNGFGSVTLELHAPVQ